MVLSFKGQIKSLAVRWQLRNLSKKTAVTSQPVINLVENCKTALLCL